MRHNNLTNYGRDMSCLLKLVEILPQTKIKSLECAPAPKCFVFMSAPVYTAVFTASRLSDNSIGGCYDDDGEFVANTEGIIALCEGLKGSSVTSLECAANPKCSPSCQRPLTAASTRPCPHAHSLSENGLGSEGGAALAEGLKGNTTLQWLK